jgi:hypothetical protein
METDPVSETLYSLVFFRIPDDGQVHEPSNSECHAPSSEPFRIYYSAMFSVLCMNYLFSLIDELNIFCVHRLSAYMPSLTAAAMSEVVCLNSYHILFT